MRKILLAACAVLSVNAVAAEGTSSMGSEYLYQAPVDKIVVTPGIDYRSLDLKYKAGSIVSPRTGAKTTGFREEVKGEFGLTDMISAGLALSHKSLKTEVTPANTTGSTTSSGLEDARAFMLGRMDMGSGSVRFGTDLSFALAKSETKTNGDSNAATGGISAEPFVGYEMYMGPGTFGGKLSYFTFIGDRKAESTSSTTGVKTSSDVSGSEQIELGLFYEHKMESLILGASVEWMSEAGQKSKAANTTTKTAGHSEVRLNLYVPFDVTPTITVLPKVTYAQYTAMDSSYIDSADYINVQAAARFAF